MRLFPLWVLGGCLAGHPWEAWELQPRDFTEEYFDRLCEAGCNDAEFICTLDGSDTDYYVESVEDCTFDVDKARACLEGRYTCAPTTGYRTVTEEPKACSDVFRC